MGTHRQRPTTVIPSGSGGVCRVLAPLALTAAAVLPCRFEGHAAVAPLRAQVALPIREAPPTRDMASPPLRFEPNEGQAAPAVRFVARGPGYTVLLTDAGAMLVPAVPPGPSLAWGGAPMAKRVVRLGLANAWASTTLVPEDRLSGVSNYFIGADPRGWRVSVPGYARVVERGAAPGVDVIYDGAGGTLAVRLLLHPGVDPSRLRLEGTAEEGSDGRAVAGPRALRVSSAASRPVSVRGAAQAAGGNAREAAPAWGRPTVSQTVGRRTVTVRAALVARGRSLMGLVVGPHDRRRALLISLPLAVAAQGSASAVGHGVAVDRAGRVYVVGTTGATDFPVTPHAVQHTLPTNDAYVMAFAPGGHRLLYSTFLGGRTESIGWDIAVDGAGNAYVSGDLSTNDPRHVDFPTTPGALSRSQGAVFVAKISPDGGHLLYSTLLGGDSGTGKGIAVDNAGCAYVTGSANIFGKGPAFPTTPGAFQHTPDPQGNAYVAKLSPDGRRLLYSTLLGTRDYGYDIAVDGVGHAYVTGNAVAADGGRFPITPGAYSQRGNLFATELTPDGRGLVYSTRLGGVSYVNNPQRGRDQANDPGGIAIDGAGDAYVTGSTVADDFPLTPHSYRRPGHGYVFPGGVFVVKLAPGGRRALYSVRFGGDTDSSSENDLLYEYDDRGHAIAVDAQGQAYVTGDVNSTNFPATPGAYERGRGGAFVTKLSADGSRILYSTRLGGAGSYDSSFSDTNPKGLNALVNDFGNDVAVDVRGHAYVVGTDNSTTGVGFPTTPGALRASTDLSDAAFNGFLAEFSPNGAHLLYSTLLGGNRQA